MKKCDHSANGLVLLVVTLLTSSFVSAAAAPLFYTNTTQLPSFPPYPHDLYSTSFRNDADRVSGVWPITKIVSLFGPTMAIFLYEKARDFYELYEPFISAAMVEFAQSVQHATKTPYNSDGVLSLSSMPSSPTNPRVTGIANEIIRLTNVRLRERAVVSRIQMDDDQYEFSKTMSASEVRNTAMQVMRNVLTRGSGQYLKDEEKGAVHSLISTSVY